MGDIPPPSSTANDYSTQRSALPSLSPRGAAAATAAAAGGGGGGGGGRVESHDQTGYLQGYAATDPQPVYPVPFQHHGQYGSQQHAYSPHFDMAQQQAMNRGAGPYNMASMANALPHQGGFRPGQSQGHGQAQAQVQGLSYSMAPPGAAASMVGGPQSMHSHTVALSAMPPGQPPYCMSPQGSMPQFYGAAVPSPQQPQDAMSPARPNVAYYQQNAAPSPYYYTQASHFPAHGQGSVMQGPMMGGRYMPQVGLQGDPRQNQQQQQSQQLQHQQQQQHQHQLQGLGSGANSVVLQGQIDGTKSEPRSNVVRGPPRKPRQKGHAIWIGNLPPQTDLMSLVYHVCKEAPGLESLFLISKSNCAFANFRDEHSCLSAQQKLHDSKFQSVRLVSRLRKSTVEGASGISAPTGPAAASQPAPTRQTQEAVGDVSALEPPPDGDDGDVMSPAAASQEPVPSGTELEVPASQKDKYFILKSLTVEDLELSVQTGIWATQSHNEKSLNNAFQSADNVFLIFSANKSGEYFGFARMTSPINEDPAAAIEFAPKAQTASDVGLPKAIPTEATEFAPRGSIMDDSERGTIFWEADPSADDQDDGASGGADADAVDDAGSTKSGGGPESKAWGKPFQLEWVSTARLPFYRARGLRNPWNSNREVKIARDGTELEPSVGRKLTSLFPARVLQNPMGARNQHHHQQAAVAAMTPAGGVGGFGYELVRPAGQSFP